MNVLVVSAEPRLVNAIRSNLPDVSFCTVQDAAGAQSELFQNSYPLALFDFEAIRGADLQTLITIDNVMLKERTEAAFMVRASTDDAKELCERLDSIRVIIDLSRGRPQFDDKVRLLHAKVRDRGEAHDDPSISTDRLIRHEVDLPALEDGSLVEFPLARVLYTIRQRKESGILTLKYAGHELKFGFVEGEVASGGAYEKSSELLGAFSWSHGQYSFSPDNASGETESVIQIIAQGCREHIRQRAITDLMTPVMRRYPVKTNLWEERKNQLLDYEILQTVMEAVDGSTNWENALSALGQHVTDGFRAAYFAIQLDMVHTVEQAGLQGIAVQYSRAVRRARAEVDRQEVEKTKAFQASSSTGRSKLSRELSVRLSMMKDETPHQIFGVWEGCGRSVVQDRFYVLVKEHHPDVYGGNTSGDVRSYAQEIFILIKDSYQELLGIEKEQTVPPPEQKAAKQTPSRTRQDTPRLHTSSGAASSEPAEEEVDVKSKLSMLSGYRKKEKHRQRLRSRQGKSEAEETSEASVASEPSIGQQESSAPEPELDPEEVAQQERQAKLDHLLKRAQSVSNPGGPNPAKEFWNKGYQLFKEGAHEASFEHFQKAYELDAKDAPILTFYAYASFLAEKTTPEEAEQLLRDALQMGDRQSAPDACLFLGHVLKAQGKVDESLKFYERTLRLNPTSREAQRELRLAEKRGHRRQKASDPGNFIKNLFKK